MTVDQIRPGMKGHGLTVFEGTKPEKFGVEVIDVIKDFRPRQTPFSTKNVPPALGRGERRARHERQPHLHRRQNDRRLRLWLELRQGARRGCDAHRQHARTSEWPLPKSSTVGRSRRCPYPSGRRATARPPRRGVPYRAPSRARPIVTRVSPRLSARRARGPVKERSPFSHRDGAGLRPVATPICWGA